MTTPSVAERLRKFAGISDCLTRKERKQLLEDAETVERYEAALEDIKSLFCPHCDADLKATNALSGGGQKG